ncbi:uncharacterized protein LOC126265703 [Aethina tumida]|uniref:uncharacterized protein LOC126265703 n=1 Tax=Aethina tumida TaxID=116153 RepID=UPI0021494A45|nr:uncharacterized protein LOC126265703 [Aethina tumida]
MSFSVLKKVQSRKITFYLGTTNITLNTTNLWYHFTMNLLDKKIYPLDGMGFPILHNISNNENVTVSFKNARFKIHNYTILTFNKNGTHTLHIRDNFTTNYKCVDFFIKCNQCKLNVTLTNNGTTENTEEYKDDPKWQNVIICSTELLRPGSFNLTLETQISTYGNLQISTLFLSHGRKRFVKKTSQKKTGMCYYVNGTNFNDSKCDVDMDKILPENCQNKVCYACCGSICYEINKFSYEYILYGIFTFLIICWIAVSIWFCRKKLEKAKKKETEQCDSTDIMEENSIYGMSLNDKL